MDEKEQEKLKKAAAEQAAMQVKANSILGVGTGSTVAFFIAALGKRKQQTDFNLKQIVTTSSRSKRQLEQCGFKVSSLSQIQQVDLTVDGADRVDDNLNGIKGGGGALTLEKNVAVNSKKNLWIVDESKLVHQLGGFGLPVEVLPISCEQNFAKFAQENLQPRWRLTSDNQRYVTHYGNYIIDLMADPVPFIHSLALYLDQTVGVVEHGLFLDLCDEVLIAHQNGQIEQRQR